MSPAVVLALMLCCSQAVSGKDFLPEMDLTKLEEVDLLPGGTFIEDSSGGKTLKPTMVNHYKIDRRFFGFGGH